MAFQRWDRSDGVGRELRPWPTAEKARPFFRREAGEDGLSKGRAVQWGVGVHRRIHANGTQPIQYLDVQELIIVENGQRHCLLELGPQPLQVRAYHAL